MRRAWILSLLVLLSIRLPSLVQPAGGDQGLYAYAGQRILAGDVMYRDAWDQKPPGIAFTYALLSRVWPHESMVPAADLVAAAATASLLVVLGRRRYSEGVGFGAASLFLLLGDPYLQRMSGIYVRAQCEPFIALAVTAALTVLARPAPRGRQFVMAGMALAAAFWLKYNAAAYALPVAAATWAWGQEPSGGWRPFLRNLALVASGFAAVSAAIIGYFTVNGALMDLRLATIDYNVRYSNETYDSPASVVWYLSTMPLERARVDMLWLVGGIGGALLLRRALSERSAPVALAWMVGAVASIAINGSRGLPNYFVQAAPALALAGSAGLATLADARAWARSAVALLLLVGLWRVGSDRFVWGFRFASLPGLIENVGYDLRRVRGRIDREAYLSRFRGQKHDALENHRLVQYIRRTTVPGDPVFVFGFSGGSVCWKSGRISSSRFYWSRPVFIEFAAEREGYGSAGLLADLQRRPPAVVALQKEDWRSQNFFMTTDRLRSWLEGGYVREYETSMFSVWRRKPVP